MDMRRLVGRNLRRVRLDKGLTQEKLAERSGYAQQYISNVERGLENPTVITVYELAQALGVVHVELVLPDEQGETEDAPPPPKRPRSKS